jgi:hypothetical protein
MTFCPGGTALSLDCARDTLSAVERVRIRPYFCGVLASER